MSDLRQHSPAAERNRQPILEVLQRLLPRHGTALEIASGTGQHVAHFASGLPGWTWQPSDPQADALASITAWCAQGDSGGLPANVRPPVRLDVMDGDWPGVGVVDAIFCANMLHIAPWPTCAALMRGAARHLAPHGVLLTYGPYLVDGVATAPGNLAFDQSLRARNPAWGIRHLADVAHEAAQAGLRLREQIAMPANNLLLVFGRAEQGHSSTHGGPA
ncbi:DUF938 domain-containing protein [Polaromonas sp. C04]|uniref:DUF938 domain-containing protein n=1 Tax=Polaromonas sp. C04 TaxID=1945857 RepID=UPI000985D588|nr:DUF938 domain-containing protein [Polaromonas sp. C04]OOG56031.1 SAM-dependent methyltransferase [Polaromonas sp. C04]